MAQGGGHEMSAGGWIKLTAKNRVRCYYPESYQKFLAGGGT